MSKTFSAHPHKRQTGVFLQQFLLRRVFGIKLHPHLRALKPSQFRFPAMATPGTPALYVTDLKFKLKNTVPEFASDGTVRYRCNLLAAASVVGYVFMETTTGQGDR
ncbi:hypothetical protein pipiens_004566 [Culex pipiens pipiens]|uniref:Uncharacterized protein n=1 Tax=Culex pipiens pipiens TaxID=38569 RepID=A0ABD1CHP8_CULPP